MPSWFERAVDPEVVVRELIRAVPELSAADPARDGHTPAGTVTGCRMIRLRAAEPEGHWTATYLVDLEGPDGPGETVSAHGTLIPPEVTDPQVAVSSIPFGADGWECWLPGSRVLLRTWSTDEALPALAAITDHRTGPAVLQVLLRGSSPARQQLTLRSITAAIASYKPGVRVTLICELTYDRSDPPASWPPTIVAKAHLGDEAAAVFDAQAALWASPLATSDVLAIAEPIGYAADLGLSVQGYLSHDRTLKDLLAEVFDSAEQANEPLPWIEATAQGLAAVHTSGVVHGGIHRWEEELASQRMKHDKLAAAVPWLAELTQGVVDRLTSAGSVSEADALAPSHGSFRTAQVVLMSDRVGIIDFDKLRQAEPAADIGPFLAKLRHTAVNKGDENRPAGPGVQERVDRIHDAFVDAYRTAAPLSLERLACWEGLEHFSLVLGSAKKGLPDRAASCADMMHRHLDLHGL